MLLELVEGGLSREDAYALRAAAAMETWKTGTPFRETLRAEARPPGRRWTRRGWTRSAGPERYVDRLGPVFDRLAALS